MNCYLGCCEGWYHLVHLCLLLACIDFFAWSIGFSRLFDDCLLDSKILIAIKRLAEEIHEATYKPSMALLDTNDWRASISILLVCLTLFSEVKICACMTPLMDPRASALLDSRNNDRAWHEFVWRGLDWREPEGRGAGFPLAEQGGVLYRAVAGNQAGDHGQQVHLHLSDSVGRVLTSLYGHGHKARSTRLQVRHRIGKKKPAKGNRMPHYYILYEGSPECAQR